MLKRLKGKIAVILCASILFGLIGDYVYANADAASDPIVLNADTISQGNAGASNHFSLRNVEVEEKEGYYYTLNDKDEPCYIPNFYPYYVLVKEGESYFTYAAEEEFTLCLDRENNNLYKITYPSAIAIYKQLQNGYHLLTTATDTTCPHEEEAYALTGEVLDYNVEKIVYPSGSVSDGDAEEEPGEDDDEEEEEPTYSVQSLDCDVEGKTVTVTGLFPDNGYIQVSVDATNMPSDSEMTSYFADSSYTGLHNFHIEAFYKNGDVFDPVTFDTSVIEDEDILNSEYYGLNYDVEVSNISKDANYTYYLTQHNPDYTDGYTYGHVYLSKFNEKYFGNYTLGEWTENGINKNGPNLRIKDYLVVEPNTSYYLFLQSYYRCDVILYDENYNIISQSSMYNARTLNTPENAKYMTYTLSYSTMKTYEDWYNFFLGSIKLDFTIQDNSAVTSVVEPYSFVEYSVGDNTISYSTNKLKDAYFGYIQLKDDYLINKLQTLTCTVDGYEFSATGFFPENSELAVEVRPINIMDELSQHTNAVYALDGKYAFYMCVKIGGHVYSPSDLVDTTEVVISGIKLDEEVLNGTYIAKDIETGSDLAMSYVDVAEENIAFSIDTAKMCSGLYVSIGELIFNRGRYDIENDPMVTDPNSTSTQMRIEEIYDLSANQDGSVKGILYENGTLIVNGTGLIKDTPFANEPLKSKIKYVYFDEGLQTSSTFMNSLFKDCVNMLGCNIARLDLTIFNSFLDTFNGCSSLIEPVGVDDIVFMPKSNISGMFMGCTALKKLELPSWNTENLGNMKSAFANTDIDFKGTLDGKDFSYCTTMNDLFNGSTVKGLDVSRWRVGENTTTVSAAYMFNACKFHGDIDISEWNSLSINTFAYFANNATVYGNVDITGFDFANMNKSASNYPFKGLICKEFIADDVKMYTKSNANQLSNAHFFRDIKADKISAVGIDFTGCTSAANLFYSARADIVDLTNANFTGITNVGNMLRAAVVGNIVGLDTIDFSTVKDWNSAFHQSTIETLNFDNPTVYPVNCESMFRASGIKTITGIGNWNMSRCTSVGYMFYQAKKLESLDVSTWNTASIENFGFMLYDCNITSVDVSSWNMTSATNTQSMFSYCGNLTSVGDMSNITFPNLIEAEYMFRDCKNLQMISANGDISKWGMGSLEKATGMFTGCVLLPSLDCHGWDMSKVTNIYRMFYDCKNMVELDVSDWKLQSLTDGRDAFNKMNGNEIIYATNLFNLSGDIETDLTNIFALGGARTAIIGMDSWKMDTVTSLQQAFYSNLALPGEFDASAWRMPKLKNCYGTFSQCKTITSFDLSNWGSEISCDVKEMFLMDKMATNINLTNTFSKVSNLSRTFDTCQGVVQIPGIENIDTSECLYTDRTFNSCLSLTSLDLSKWDLSEDLTASQMFEGCSALTTTGNLANFKFGKCTDFNNMFHWAPALTYIGNIENWDMSAATDIEYMFYNEGKSSYISKANVGDISKWDLAQVTSSDYAFAMQRNNDINVPDTLKVIGNCMYLDNLALDDDTLPSGAISVGNDAFLHCPKVLVSTIPNTLADENIGAYAFPAVINIKYVEDDGYINANSNVVEAYTGIGYHNSPIMTWQDVDDIFYRMISIAGKDNAMDWLYSTYCVLMTPQEYNEFVNTYGQESIDDALRLNPQVLNVVNYKSLDSDYKVATDYEGNEYFFNCDLDSTSDNIYHSRYKATSNVVASGEIAREVSYTYTSYPTWTLYGNGDLVLYSETPQPITGAMWNSPPWEKHKSKVKTVIVDGVTNLPTGFCTTNYPNLKTVILKDSVKKIGNNAFHGCNIADTWISSSLREYGNYYASGTVHYEGNSYTWGMITKGKLPASNAEKTFIPAFHEKSKAKINRDIYGICYYDVLTDAQISTNDKILNIIDKANNVNTASAMGIPVVLSDTNERYIGEKYFTIHVQDENGVDIDLTVKNSNGVEVDPTRLLANKTYFIEVPFEYVDEETGGFSPYVKIHSFLTITRQFTGSPYIKTSVSNDVENEVRVSNVKLLDIR